MRCLLHLVSLISIHAPHEGERPVGATLICATFVFQSTLPTRGSDFYSLCQQKGIDPISIHAPHEGERPRMML